MIDPLGDYEVVSETRTKEAALRLLRLKAGQRVLPHFHRHCTQVYLIIAGSVDIQLGDGHLWAKQYDTVRIPPMTVHSLKAIDAALVLSTTTPPLLSEDQISLAPGKKTASGGE